MGEGGRLDRRLGDERWVGGDRTDVWRAGERSLWRLSCFGTGRRSWSSFKRFRMKRCDWVLYTFSKKGVKQTFLD
jgi:hypothetical protein